MESVVTRLEAVASRLEAYEGRLGAPAVAEAAPSAAVGGHTPPKFGVPLPGLTPAKKPAAPAAPAAAPSSGGAASLNAWDAQVTPALRSFVNAAQEVGPEVAPMSELVEKAFQAERTVVDAIGQCQKPDKAGLSQLLAPVGAQLQAANALTEGRRTAAFNHSKAVAEALQALSWVAYSGPASMSPPAQHVQEAWQSAEFWANKILMEHRASSPPQVAWVKALQALLAALKGFVESHHRAGPAWQAQGAPVATFTPSPAAGSAAAATAAAKPVVPPRPPGGAPPPPPPPPAAGSLFKAKGPAAGGGAAPAAGAGLSAVFSEINKKGDGVTSGLRKVTDDMKTKNRTDRTGAVPAGPSKAAAAPSAVGGKGRPAAPPRTECEQGRKWVVENHVGAGAPIEIADTNPKQTVYIYRCQQTTIQVRGKVNALTLDACSKVGVVFDSLVAACEVVNSSGVQVQATGVVPTIAVDKCDGVQLYLSEASLGASITTAKSSAVNVLIPGQAGQDMAELYVPEQFTSTVENGRLVTVPVSHSGG